MTLAVPLTATKISSSDPLEECVRGAIEGDAAAAHRLCLELGPVALRTLRQVLGNGHPDLEDVLQDTLVAVLDSLESFKRESSLRHFVRRIATFRALEFLRNTRRRTKRLGALGEEDLQLERPTSPYDDLATRRSEQMLHELLASLVKEHAEVLTLRIVLDHPIAEIAEILGIPLNTVRGRLAAARNVVRAKLRHPSEFSELLDKADS